MMLASEFNLISVKGQYCSVLHSLLQLASNMAKGQISKQLLRENKACHFPKDKRFCPPPPPTLLPYYRQTVGSHFE